MKISEAIEWINNRMCWGRGQWTEHHQPIIDEPWQAGRMAIEALQNSQWIPCSERMPEPRSWAIWCSNKGIIQVARWKEDAIDHFFPSQGFFNLEDAVAWMPLPKPWKGEDDEEVDVLRTM